MADPISFPDEPFDKIIGRIGRLAVREPKHKTPYISVSKLGEYLTVASANRRKTIVRDMKYGDTPKWVRYKDFHDPASAALAAGSLLPVHNAIESLSGQSGGSDFAKEDRTLTIMALKRFAAIFPKLDLSGYTVIDRHKHSGRFELFGVEVSVRPESILKFTNRTGTHVGGVKLVVSKTKPMTQAWGEYIGAALHQYLDGAFKVEPAQSSCFVVDVFAKATFIAPRAFKKRREDIAGACQEIALWWDNL